jgi:hypothetical protein
MSSLFGSTQKTLSRHSDRPGDRPSEYVDGLHSARSCKTTRGLGAVKPAPGRVELTMDGTLIGTFASIPEARDHANGLAQTLASSSARFEIFEHGRLSEHAIMRSGMTARHWTKPPRTILR